ncbi:50S ribosomal protein L23 [Verrucomicrobiota bacterium]
MKNTAGIVRRVQLTEKATDLSETRNQYFFEVHPDANKIEIKRAVEKLFGVQVKGVNTMRYSGKRKRERTVRYGRRPDWKRAVITLKPGEKIELA